MSTRAAPAGGDGVRAVLRLAWPAAASYLLNNVYRINDQFWVQGLGAQAQAALGAMMFVLIGWFAVVYLAAGGTLSLVSQATGAGDRARADAATRHALGLGVLLAAAGALVGPLAAPHVCRLLELDGPTAALATDYAGTLLLLGLPLALAAVLDHVFIGRGCTWIPMVLQATAVLLNFLFNPILIYGAGAREAMAGVAGVAPFAHWAASASEVLGIEGMGMRGAAIATALSRVVTVLIALVVLRRKFGVDLLGSLRPDPRLALSIARISAPVSLSIATYAGVYWALLALVLGRLPHEVTAALGLGFQVFEGLAFPTYLGTSMACASLVGQRLGAGEPGRARAVTRSARSVSRALGVVATLAFLAGARIVAPRFTLDPLVLEQTILYVHVLAFSQYFVAVEVVDEKVLLAAGRTRPILWIAGSGDLLRIPLAWLLAIELELGAAGVWWAINATTYYKAIGMRLAVERAVWRAQPSPA